MTDRILSPNQLLSRAQIVDREGIPTATFLRFLSALYERTGGVGGSVFFNILSGSTFTQLFEDTQGNTYLTNNARWVDAGAYWERIDETRSAWMLVLLGVSEPLEEAIGLPAQTAGFWIAQPSIVGGVPNPAFVPESPTRKIKDGFTGAAGGWERGISVTQFGDFVIRGFGLEKDHNGIVPFSRSVGGFSPDGVTRWHGELFNVYLDHSGSDRARKGSMAQVLRSLVADDDPYDWAVLFADPTDPSAAADQVGTTAPAFTETAIRVERVVGSVNRPVIKPSLTTAPVLIEAEGSDADIGVTVAPKGAGSLRAKGTGTGMTVQIEDGTTTAGHVGVKAVGNSAYIRAGNNDVVEVDSAGNTRLGVGAVATTATDGFAYIPTVNGTPTGTPTTKTGMAPVVYDSANNLLYIYNGGWKSAAFT